MGVTAGGADPQAPALLITVEAIQRRVGELGQQLTTDYSGRRLVVVGVLTGALVFVADLIRHIRLPMELDLVEASSYGDATRPRGDVELGRWLSRPVEGKSVLIVEDIVDTGATLSDVRGLILGMGPRDVAACALLDKPARRAKSVTLEYCGFVIEDHFVVGYGLDRAGLYRNLPYIGVVQS